MNAARSIARILTAKIRRENARRLRVDAYSPAAFRVSIDDASFELSFLADETEAVGDWLAARFECMRSGTQLAAPAFELWAPSKPESWTDPFGYFWTARADAAQRTLDR